MSAPWGAGRAVGMLGCGKHIGGVCGAVGGGRSRDLHKSANVWGLVGVGFGENANSDPENKFGWYYSNTMHGSA